MAGFAPGTDFSGQVAVVTGGGGGLGSDFSREIARRGAAVVVNDLGGSTTGEGSSAGYADAVVSQIRDAGGTAIANYDTVGTEAGGQAIIDAAMAEFGRVDVVISNAGNQRNGRFGDLTAEDIEAVHAVHVLGAFFVCQPAYRRMSEQGYGRLVLVSSQSGIFGNPFRSNYGSAKTALIGLMNVIAQEAPEGLAVNCLFPNARGSRLAGGDLSQRPDAAWLVQAGQRSQGFAQRSTPEFVTPLAVYLASRSCTTSQGMYSALGGTYSRIFVGLTEGWSAPGALPPTSEDLLDHLAEIDDRTCYSVPRSGLEEMDAVLAKQASDKVPAPELNAPPRAP